MGTIEIIGIIIGMTTGITGLVLGIVNAIHQRSTVRPRLRVEPSILHIVSRGIPGAQGNVEHNVGAMTILNIGNVPVMGSSIGFCLKDKKKGSLVVITPHAINGTPWPAEILPGRSIALRMNTDKLREDHGNNYLGKAFVRTAIGDCFYASKKTMKNFELQLDEWTEPEGNG
jgi:hypothetical protein